jgi:hypothetical protein
MSILGGSRPLPNHLNQHSGVRGPEATGIARLSAYFARAAIALRERGIPAHIPVRGSRVTEDRARYSGSLGLNRVAPYMCVSVSCSPFSSAVRALGRECSELS